MRIPELCAKCLYDHQKSRCPEAEYLRRVQNLIDERREQDTAPLLVYRFDLIYEQLYSRRPSYAAAKQKYNDLVLAMADGLRARIGAAEDPLACALTFARVGNFIDFGAMDSVDESAFLSLFDGARLREEEKPVYERFLAACAKAKRFMLIADNCGEIVLDRLFLEALKARFPQLSLSVLVRGAETLNDVTEQDARYAGVDKLAHILHNGAGVAGTVLSMLPEKTRRAFDGADVILSKGQGNYESLAGCGKRIFYSLLCKCELFTQRFHVPRFTGIFVEEN